MYVEEYIYEINQVVTSIDKDNTTVECDIHYKYETIKFVLGFGIDCEIVDPERLREKVKRIATAIADKKLKMSE